MIDKDKIISEIKRTAFENGNIPLGQEKFSKLTGIKKHIWWGKYWRTWNDALKESGFLENKLNPAYDKELLLKALAELIRVVKNFPASVDLRMARKADPSFPSHNTFDRLGNREQKIFSLKEFISHNQNYKDILPYLPSLESYNEENDNSSLNKKTKEGFVYLGMLKIDTKKRYKIGRTNLVERRNTELSLQLPEKLELVHYIKTDDMVGIEAYWHRRFSEKHTNGEWFDLSTDDVRTFKLRKSM